MDILPPPLQALGAYPQFILYKLVPRTEAKTDKLPVDHRTMQVFKAADNWQQDPAACTSFENASFLAGQLGPDHGVGFFFTERDPFFFVDIDDCLLPDGSGWVQTALDAMGMLPGAAVEVSQSGKGLHIFGTYVGAAPTHSCKNSILNADLYTVGRFVALTGDRAMGSAAVDCTAPLKTFADIHYAPREFQVGQEWTAEPDPEYTGPENDAELIQKALGSKSAGSVFSGSSNFAALWAADEDALSKSYPPDQGDRAYDGSSADAALAQHLAFWTGKNCDRMLRLMHESALVRDKWDREDYLTRTIMHAVSLQKTVYSVVKTTAAELGGPKLKGTGPQVDFAAGIRAQKLTECTDDQTGTDLLLKVRESKFWIDNKDKSAADLIKSLTPIDSAGSPLGNADGPEFVAGYQYLGAQQQADFFKGCVYIQDEHKVFTPFGSLLKSEQFNATYGGYVFAMDDGGEKTTRKAFEAFTESQVVRYPKAETTCFRPAELPGALIEQNSRMTVNTYTPIETKRLKGDATPFLRHLGKLLPDQHDQQILLSYMAACVQYKGVKFQWAPLIQGVEGNGKTFFTSCVAAALGEKYVHLPPASEISEKFNAWLFNKLFIGVEDIYVSEHRREVLEILKPMITSSRLARRAMQTDQTMHDVCCNFIFNSNHADAIRKTQNDRRFAVFYAAQQASGDLKRDGLDGAYFPDLYAWLRADGYAIVTEFLHTYPIPAGFNPAVDCHRAPVTSSTAAAISASLGGIEQEILEAIDEDRPGFAGGWVSSMALDLLLKNKRKDTAVPINKRRELLKVLGYEWHPGLSNGRVNNPVMPDNGKPRLFIKTGHAALNLQGAKMISKAYETAQVGAGGAIGKAAEFFGGGV